MKIEDATPAQQEAITTNHPRVIVLAGPGSGKTATTVARIQRLIADGVPHERIAAITFTNNAARELEQRLAPRPMDPMSAELAAVLVGNEGVARMNHGPSLAHCGTLHAFCLKLLRDHGEDIGYGKRLSIISPESAADLLASKATTLGVKLPLKDLLALKAKGRPARGFRLDLAQTCVATYFDELKEAGIVDFDVLLTEALELIRAVQIDLGIDHLFVDEVQDSSLVDWLIYKALPVPSKFLVGDPDQAIYSFRGGDVGLMTDYARDTQVLVIKLEENFRSKAEICDAANRLIAQNTHRIHKETRSVKGEGGTVRVLEAAINEGEEIGRVAQSIKTSHGEGLDGSSIAVLTRTNAIAAAYRATFAACGIPVAKREASSLPADWPFARAFIEFLVNPENDVLAFFFLTALYVKKGATPKDARDAAHAARKAAAASGKSLNRASVGTSIYNTIPDVPELLRLWGASMDSRMLVAEKIKELGISAKVLDLALAMAGTREVLPVGEAEGCVEVLTVHGAKGREFDVVFVVGCEDEVTPGRRKGTDVEEERRLFYVACTRARNMLVLAHATSRVTPWGAIEAHTPSRFLLEATKKLAP